MTQSKKLQSKHLIACHFLLNDKLRYAFPLPIIHFKVIMPFGERRNLNRNGLLTAQGCFLLLMQEGAIQAIYLNL